jgi:hypothetical protein
MLSETCICSIGCGEPDEPVIGGTHVSEPNQPIGDVLRGIEIEPVPEGWTVVDALVLAKCLNVEGQPIWSLRFTEGLNSEELLGALQIQVELLTRGILEDWQDR